MRNWFDVIPTVAEESLLAGGIPRLHFISLGMTCMWLIVIEIKTLRNVFAGDDVQTFIYLTGIGGDEVAIKFFSQR